LTCGGKTDGGGVRLGRGCSGEIRDVSPDVEVVGGVEVRARGGSRGRGKGRCGSVDVIGGLLSKCCGELC
jgi:hypothetical protein